MTHLYSWNVNGLRSVRRKGFDEWLKKESPDILCLQEIKANQDQVEEGWHPANYWPFWFSAQKPGYSGLLTLTKTKPVNIQSGLGIDEFDREARTQTLEFENFFLVNSYFPNSQRDHARLGFKLSFCEAIHSYLDDLRKLGKGVVLCGDFNIAHQEIDLKNPKTNTDNAGFLPEERAWMTQFLDSGYRDIFRDRTKEPDHYTWWSYRPGIRERNVGWRLDYHVVSPELSEQVLEVHHHTHVLGSDHCPVSLKIK